MEKKFTDYGDYKLIMDCQSKAGGADIHDVNGIIGLYRHHDRFAEIHEDEEDRERSRHNAEVCERTLRIYLHCGNIKEAKKFYDENWIYKQDWKTQ